MSDSTTAPFGLAQIGQITVPDIYADHQVLSARGVAFEREPHLVAKLLDHELWMTFFRDPDDKLLALMSEIRP